MRSLNVGAMLYICTVLRDLDMPGLKEHQMAAFKERRIYRHLPLTCPGIGASWRISLPGVLPNSVRGNTCLCSRSGLLAKLVPMFEVISPKKTVRLRGTPLCVSIARSTGSCSLGVAYSVGGAIAVLGLRAASPGVSNTVGAYYISCAKLSVWKQKADGSQC